jgi:serine/threonine protein phosphatase 1
MRTLAIGDIHGCSKALDALLAAIAPSRDDLVIALGDFVDWGPDSCGVLNRLIELSKHTRLVSLRGNHEEMIRDVKPHCSGKTVVCGHATQRDGQPRSIGHAICIDTGVSCGGWLTCLEPMSGMYCQANERGKLRRGCVREEE